MSALVEARVYEGEADLLAMLDGDPGPAPDWPGYGLGTTPRLAAVVESRRLEDAGAFILDGAINAPAIWGVGPDVAWAVGEPLMFVGPPGVGKTTVLQQLAFRRQGILSGPLLGMPVERADGPGLYIAADRPSQAARSARRMVEEHHRGALAANLSFWRGPLPFDLGRCDRGTFADFLEAECPGISDVYIDSLKDVAVKLTDDEVGSRVNAELQEVIARGIEVVTDHHQRKASGDNKRPQRLDDVYGSTWLTAGCGSVVLLWGQAGDAVLELLHLKQPSGDIGPLRVRVDHASGSVELFDGDDADLLRHAQAAIGDGLTARVAAVVLYGNNNPSENEIEKARGKLKRDGRLEEVAGSRPAAWRPKAGAL